jgi:tetratricopeptide (TPR) repeat protein
MTLSGPLFCMGSNAAQQLVTDGDKLVRELKLSDAEKKYREALQSFESVGDKGGVATVLEKVGNLASDLGDYVAAVRCYAQARSVYASLHQRDGQVKMLTAIGTAYSDWGDMPGAVHYYKEALSLEPSPPDRALIESKLGAVYLVLGDDDECISHLRAGKSAAAAARDMRLLGAILLQMGDVYQKIGSPDEARTTYNEVLGMKDRAELTTQAQIGLGDIFLAGNNAAEAEALYRKASYAIGLGRVSLARGQFENALESFQHALKEGERRNDFQLLFAARTGLGLTFGALGQSPKAEENLMRAVEALEETRALLPVGKKMYFLSGSTHGFSRLAVYEALIVTLAAEEKKDEAFKFAEYTRSRLLTETLTKTNLVQNEVESTPAGSTSTAVSVPTTSHDAPQVPIELAPFSFSNRQLSKARADSLDGAALSLLLRAVFLDFDKTEADQADSMRDDCLRKAGFNTKVGTTLKSKLTELRQKGVQNHLTTSAEAEAGKK